MGLGSLSLLGLALMVVMVGCPQPEADDDTVDGQPADDDDIADDDTSDDDTGDDDTSGSSADPDGPYGDCADGAAGCAVPDSLCPGDITGTVCAPPCETQDQCPDLAGAANAPSCVSAGEYGPGNVCIVPCTNGECPDGMPCLYLNLGEPQCAWEPT